MSIAGVLYKVMYILITLECTYNRSIDDRLGE